MQAGGGGRFAGGRGTREFLWGKPLSGSDPSPGQGPCPSPGMHRGPPCSRRGSCVLGWGCLSAQYVTGPSRVREAVRSQPHPQLDTHPRVYLGKLLSVTKFPHGGTCPPHRTVGACTLLEMQRLLSRWTTCHGSQLLSNCPIVSDSATPWTAACQAPLSFTISQNLLKFMSTESVMPSNALILCCPLLILPSIFPSIMGFSNESVLGIRWPKYWSFSFSISLSNEYSGLISFRIDWFDRLAVQRTLKSLFPIPQFKSINSSVLSLRYDPTLTSVHDYWKKLSFDDMDLCQQSDVSAF